MKANQVCDAINAGEFTADELRRISLAVRSAYDAMQRHKRAPTFAPGDRVQANRYGSGVVCKVNDKSVIVAFDNYPNGGNMRCSPSILTKV